MFAQHIIEEMLFVNYLIQDCIKKEFLFDEWTRHEIKHFYV